MLQHRAILSPPAHLQLAQLAYEVHLHRRRIAQLPRRHGGQQRGGGGGSGLCSRHLAPQVHDERVAVGDLLVVLVGIV